MAFTMLNIAELGPMPSASVMMASALKPGDFSISRAAKRTSWINVFNNGLLSSIAPHDRVRLLRHRQTPGRNWRDQPSRTAQRVIMRSGEGAKQEGRIFAH